jgi:hypothetical protein
LTPNHSISRREKKRTQRNEIKDAELPSQGLLQSREQSDVRAIIIFDAKGE